MGITSAVIKGVISELEPEMRDKINQYTEQIQKMIDEDEVAGKLALALMGAKYSEEE